MLQKLGMSCQTISGNVLLNYASATAVLNCFHILIWVEISKKILI
jgi:hypothetical protein